MIKLPQRTCIVCRNETLKRQLVRIVRSKEGEISLDLTGKKSGRGAYVCKCEDCVKKLISTKALNRAFKMEVEQEVYQNLIKELNFN